MNKLFIILFCAQLISCNDNSNSVAEIESNQLIELDTTFYQVDYALINSDTVFNRGKNLNNIKHIFQINKDYLSAFRYDLLNDSLYFVRVDGGIFTPFNDSLGYSIHPSEINFDDFIISSGYSEASLAYIKTNEPAKGASVILKQLKVPRKISNQIDSLFSCNENGLAGLTKYNFKMDEFIDIDSWNIKN
jgi:hypothetical protein